MENSGIDEQLLEPSFSYKRADISSLINRFSLITIKAMGKCKELSLDLRAKLVEARKAGQGYKSISKRFMVPTSTVWSIIAKKKVHHSVVN